jgi:hypothetical protein
MGTSVAASVGLRGVLSDHALAVFDRLHLVRDTSRTCTTEVLGKTLRERGWPIYEAASELEEAVGGVLLGGKTLLGVCAALASFAARDALRLLTHEGATLLPVDGSEMPELWMGPDGTLYRGVQGDLAGGDDDDFAAPLYENWKSFLERFAFQRETWLRADHEIVSRHPYYAATDALAGVGVAEALGASRFVPACDRFAQIWDGPRGHVQEIYSQGNRVGTQAWGETPDDLVAVLLAIAARAPDVPIRFGGPCLAAPVPGQAIAYALSERDAHTGRTSRILVAGRPGDWRIARAEGSDV